MVDQVANFKKVTVNTTYDDSATSIVLSSGHGAELPDPSGDNYNLIWWDSTNYGDPADDPNVEIIRVTAISTDTLTVTRNQESSGASTKNTGGATYKMVLGYTAKTITDLESAAGSSTVNIYLPAEAAYLPDTNPATLTEVLGTTTYAGFSYLAFDDTTSEHAIWRTPLPDYDGGNIVVTSFSKVATEPVGTATLLYNILTIGLANSETFDTAVTVDTTVDILHSLTTSSAIIDILIASATIDPANVTSDDLLVIELSRNMSDTLFGDSRLVGIMLEYARN